MVLCMCAVSSEQFMHRSIRWIQRLGYGLDNRGTGALSLQVQEIFPLSITSRLTLGPTHSPMKWAPPSNADVNSGGAITTRPHTSLWYDN
jgi:hypothetical protein